jgi:hypothetical protein
MPISTTSARPVSSTIVQTTFSATDSSIPRRLISAISATTTIATRTIGRSTNVLR